MKIAVTAALLLFGLSAVAFGQYKKGSLEDKLIQLDMAWTFAELKGRQEGGGCDGRG